MTFPHTKWNVQHPTRTWWLPKGSKVAMQDSWEKIEDTTHNIAVTKSTILLYQQVEKETRYSVIRNVIISNHHNPRVYSKQYILLVNPPPS